MNLPLITLRHLTEPFAIVSPASTEETATVLKFCSEHKRIVSPRGGSTKVLWGNPVEPQIALHTHMLTGVREHSWQDLTATVGAGTSWAVMQDTLLQHGQRVALDPLLPLYSTVGGIVATNDSGSLRMRYGSLRDLVIGMTIVLADGTIARSGGRVVKNVAGYDLPKLLIGSFGTLGIITEVTFRLHPEQRHTQTWTIRADEAQPLVALHQQLLNAAMSIESLQIRLDSQGFALDVCFASLPEVLREHETRLREICAPHKLSAASMTVWTERASLFLMRDAAVLKITALANKTGAILQGLRSLTSSDVTATCVADSTGITTVALISPPTRGAAIIDDLRKRLRGDGGMLVVLRPGSSLPDNVDRWGDPPPAIEVMRAIKQQFDPDRLLNPGKFVGGI